MKTLHADLEALMPEPVAFARKWHADGEIPAKVGGRWPGKFKLHATSERQCLPDDAPLFTADQVREAMQAVNERAAKLAATLAYDAAIKYANGREVDFEKDVGDAIRGAGGGV